MKSLKPNYNIKVIIFLSISFLIYNFFVYTQGTENNTPPMSQLAINGEKLFQANNCTACHQFYGLGGYLGPDLTNVISNKSKGPGYVKAFLNSGVKSMPKFNFNEQEKDALVQFLKEVDQTGFYPNFNAEKKLTGWVKLKYKNQ